MVKKRDYSIANGLLTIEAIAAGLLILVGIIGVFNGPDMRGSGELAVFGIAIVIALKVSAIGSIFTGLLLLASVQTARAHIHTAEMTWEMLELARKAEVRAASNVTPAIYAQSTLLKSPTPAAAPPMSGQPGRGGNVISDTSEGIDRAYLTVGSIASAIIPDQSGKENEIFIFNGGKVRMIVGTAVMEFGSKEEAIAFLNGN